MFMSSFLPEPDFENDPSTITVEIAGVERPWYLGAESLEIARETHGVEPGDIFQDAEDAHQSVTEGVEAAAQLVWAGFLVFAPDLTVREVKQHISFPPSDALMGPINQHLGQLEDEQTDGIAGKATAGG